MSLIKYLASVILISQELENELTRIINKKKLLRENILLNVMSTVTVYFLLIKD